MREFFRVNSYGNTDIVATIIDWTVTDNTESFYALTGDMGRTFRFAPAFTPSLERAEAMGVDFSQFDQDNDGFLDLTVVLYSGYDALEGPDCNTGAPVEEMIAGFALTGPPGGDSWVSSDGFYRLGAYGQASAFLSNCNFNMARSYR